MTLSPSMGVKSHPIDLAEDLAMTYEWTCDRQDQDDLTLFISAQYTDLQFRIFWKEDLKTLQFACLFDLKVPEKRLNEVLKLLGMINERLWFGHFEYWAAEDVLLFRHASLAADQHCAYFDSDHISMVMETAVRECDVYFPVFQYVMWGGMSAANAIDAAMLECVGSA